HLRGLLVASLQVGGHVVWMLQRPRQDGVHVSRSERVKRLDDVRGAGALLIQQPDALEAHARLADTQPTVTVVAQRNGNSFQRKVHRGFSPARKGVRTVGTLFS